MCKEPLKLTMELRESLTRRLVKDAIKDEMSLTKIIAFAMESMTEKVRKLSDYEFRQKAIEAGYLEK